MSQPNQSPHSSAHAQEPEPPDEVLTDLLAALEFLMSRRPKVARALHVETVQHRVALIQQRARREGRQC